MNELQKGIRKLFDDTPGLAAAFPGGIWQDMAPEDTKYPFVVFNLVPAQVQATYDPDASFFTATVRFRAFGGRTQVGPEGQLFGQLDAVFSQEMELSDGAVMFHANRPQHPTTEWVGRDRTGEDLWMASATYEYCVSGAGA